MSDPLPRGNTELQNTRSDQGDRAGTATGNAIVNAPSTLSNALTSVGNGISNAWNSVTGSGTPTTSTGDSAGSDDEDTDPNTPGVQRRSSYRWGNMLGGLLGVGGAWLLSNIFGGGWLGTIVFALVAIPAFMMGRGQLGGMLSGMLGEQPSPAAGRSPEITGPGQAQTQGQGTGQVAAAPETPQVTPQQRLQQEVAEVAQKTQIAGATIAQLVQTGEMTPRRAQAAMRTLGEYQQMVAGMQRIDINQLSPEQLQDIHRRFNSAEANLDRVIGRNPIVAAQIQQSIRPAQPPVQPVAGTAQPFVGGTVAIGSTLDPQAQAQVAALRSQGYAYAPAYEAPSASPSFSGAQYMAPQRVN